jgi:predicted GIY-YIG superfamily endonuclease
MVLTALSRCKTLKDLHFVSGIGDHASIQQIREDSVQGVIDALNKNSVFAEHISFVLRSLDFCQTRDMKTVARPTAFPLLETGIPACDACYLLVSKVHPNIGYCGQTINFRRRLAEHNSKRGGSQQTDFEHLKPWLPVMMVTGFPTDNVANHLRAFEHAWRRYNNTPSSQECDYSVKLQRNCHKVLAEFQQKVDSTGQQLYPHLQLIQYLNIQQICKLFISILLPFLLHN